MNEEENSNEVVEEKTFTQAEVDKFVGKARIDARKKYAEELDNYENLKNEFNSLKEKTSNYEELNNKLEEVKKANEEMKFKISLNEWKEKASKETGIPTDILRGETEDEIMQHAQLIKDTIKYPQIDNGNLPMGDGNHNTKQPLERIADKVFDAFNEI